MNRPKKNSMSVSGNLSQSTEAAIRLFPRASSKNKETDEGPIDKDGFDGSSMVQTYIVEVALNGFFVTVIFDDLGTPDLRYVVQTMDEVVEIMRGNF